MPVRTPIRETTYRYMSSSDERDREAAQRNAADLGLTAREIQVVTEAAAGRTNAEIARSLELSPRTVQRHLERIFDKVGVRTRAGAVARIFGTEEGEL